MPLPNTSERQQEYMAHRVRVQNAKSVVNSQPPSRAVSKPRREMSFTEMMNSVRTAIQRSSNSRTFTNKPASVTSTATSVTTSTVAATSSRTSPPTRGSKTSRIKSSNSDAFDGYERDKSAMLLYDCKSCGAFGCCCCCGGAGDGRHCMSSCVDMHQKFSQHSGGDISASDSLRPMGNHMPIYQRSSYFSGNTSTSAVVHSTQSSDAQLRNLQEKIKKSSQAPTAEQRAIYQHARLAMPLRSFWHRITRKEWNDDTRIPPKPRRPSHVLLRNSRKRCVQRKSCSEGSHSSELINHPSALACQDECKNSTIPLHVLKRYQDITVTNDESMLRRLLRPRVFFDLEVKGIRPLGRIVIQLFTEACPEVVLEFVRMCTTEKGERMSFTRLFPPMWLEGELALTDNKTLTAHNIEHDTNVLDHGCGAGVLSFPSRYVRGSKRRFLSFSISFKPLKVLNGKRIAFGRVKRGFWILDAVQDYGTNSGKPQREIIVTGCGICK